MTYSVGVYSELVVISCDRFSCLNKIDSGNVKEDKIEQKNSPLWVLEVAPPSIILRGDTQMVYDKYFGFDTTQRQALAKLMDEVAGADPAALAALQAAVADLEARVADLEDAAG